MKDLGWPLLPIPHYPSATINKRFIDVRNENYKSKFKGHIEMTRANDWHKNLSTQTPNTLRYSGVLSVRTILAVVFRPFPERPRHTLKTWKVFPGRRGGI